MEAMATKTTLLTPVLEFWMVREIGTKRFLPQHKGAHTWSEFTHKGVPRLHASHRAAAVSLSWWLRGQTNLVKTPGRWAGTVIAKLEFAKGYKKRDRATVEIVRVELVVAGD